MIYLFDVDGVLTDTGYNIDKRFEQWFLSWAEGKRYALVTGSTLERTVEQIGNQIVDGALFVANCMGNSLYQEGKTTVLNEFEFNEEEEEFLMKKVEISKFPIRAGNHISARPGSFNFSVVGRNATVAEREQYKEFDNNCAERLQIAEEFKERFPHYDVFIGGDISIDICLQGAHKGQVYEFASYHLLPNEKLAFFGDKMDMWGIDRPLKEIIQQHLAGRAYHISDGCNQTKNILMYDSTEDIDFDEADSA